METVFPLLVDQPTLSLFLLIGVGMAFGHVKIRGIGLGVTAVLFLAIALAVQAQACGIKLVVTKQLGILGLVLSIFTTGINSGASFFHNLKIATSPILTAVPLHVLTATIGLFAGKAMGMDITLTSGTFIGAVTNAPALNTAGKTSDNLVTATVGYSIAYLFGVTSMLIVSVTALVYSKNDRDQPSPLVNRTTHVECGDHPFIGDIYQKLSSEVILSRLRRGETGPITRPSMSDTPDQSNLMIVVEPRGFVARAATELGHTSSHSLIQDRGYLDFRRVTASDPKTAGQTVTDPGSATQFLGTISRMCRGDTGIIAEPDSVLQQGDRIRTAAPTSKVEAITKFFSDSAHGFSNLDPIALGLGMVLGIAIGELPIPIPSGEYFSIGPAMGTLIIGLIFGRLGRIGPIVTVLLFTASQVLSELGLLVLLAQVGAGVGGQIAYAFTSGMRIKIVVLGFITATIIAVGTYVTMRWIFKMSGTQFSDLLGGAQTQPAVLAFTDGRTSSDSRIALDYALTYPIAIVSRILVTQILGGM